MKVPYPRVFGSNSHPIFNVVDVAEFLAGTPLVCIQYVDNPDVADDDDLSDQDFAMNLDQVASLCENDRSPQEHALMLWLFQKFPRNMAALYNM